MFYKSDVTCYFLIIISGFPLYSILYLKNIYFFPCANVFITIFTRPDNGEAEPARDMSVEEMKEFMDEQRKRYATLGDDIDDDDDYYDNDAEMDYGDDPNDDEEVPSSPLRSSNVINTSLSHQIQVNLTNTC